MGGWRGSKTSRASTPPAAGGTREALPGPVLRRDHRRPAAVRRVAAGSNLLPLPGRGDPAPDRRRRNHHHSRLSDRARGRLGPQGRSRSPHGRQPLWPCRVPDPDGLPGSIRGRVRSSRLFVAGGVRRRSPRGGLRLDARRNAGRQASGGGVPPGRGAPMSARAMGMTGRVLVVAREEYRRALESRWLFGFTALLAALVLGLSFFGLAQGREVGFQGFARVTLSLMNLVLFIVPLTGLLLGVTSVTGASGALPLLLAQPVSRAEVLMGKL